MADEFADAPLPDDSQGRMLLLGEILWLLLQSPLHRRLTVDAVEAYFVAPLSRNRLRFFRRGPAPVGLVTWAHLGAEAEARYLAGDEPLRPEDWDSGPQLWFVDMIAPFGDGRAISSEMRRRIPPGGVGKASRRNADGSLKRVVSYTPLG
jgi:cytolysin-activating lysine-acyltransferase